MVSNMVSNNASRIVDNHDIGEVNACVQSGVFTIDALLTVGKGEFLINHESSSFCDIRNI